MNKYHAKRLGYRRIHTHPELREIEQLKAQAELTHVCVVIQTKWIRHHQLWAIPKGAS